MNKKRNHYVSQLYLRFFSENKKTISLFSIKDNISITNKAPIKRQCYSNYLYSKNPIYEDTLSKIESKSKCVFDTIINTKKIPKKNTEDYEILLIFILFQSMRTQYEIDKRSEEIEKILKIMVKEQFKLEKPEGFTLEDIENSRITYNEPGALNLSVISDIIPLMKDLECKLIINNLNKEFITSDNPVILLNKYLIDEDGPITGYTCKGFLMLFPLHPHYYIIFYDKNIYKIGGNNLNKPINEITYDDINELNTLQLINAYHNCYYLNHLELDLKKNNDKAKKFKTNEKAIVKEGNIKIDNDENRYILTSKRSIKYDPYISFIKISKMIPIYYKNDKDVVRNRLLIDLNQEFLDEVKKGNFKYTDWPLFLDTKI